MIKKKQKSFVSKKFIQGHTNDDDQFVVPNISFQPINRRSALYHASQGEDVAIIKDVFIRNYKDRFINS